MQGLFNDACCYDTTTPGIYQRQDNKAFKRAMLKQARDAGFFGGETDPDACAPKDGRIRGWVVAHQGLDVSTFVRLVLANSDKTMRVTMYVPSPADADTDGAKAAPRAKGKKASSAAAAEAGGWVNVKLEDIKSTAHFYKTVAWLVLTMELQLDTSKCTEFGKVLAATGLVVANAKTGLLAAAALKRSRAKILLEKTNKRNAMEEAAKAALAVRRAYKSDAQGGKSRTGAGARASDDSEVEDDEEVAAASGADGEEEEEGGDKAEEEEDEEEEEEEDEGDDDEEEDDRSLDKPALLKVLKRTRAELESTLTKLVDMTEVVSLMRERRRVDDERQKRLLAIEARKYPMHQKSRKMRRMDLATVVYGGDVPAIDSDSDSDADADERAAGVVENDDDDDA